MSKKNKNRQVDLGVAEEVMTTGDLLKEEKTNDDNEDVKEVVEEIKDDPEPIPVPVEPGPVIIKEEDTIKLASDRHYLAVYANTFKPLDELTQFIKNSKVDVDEITVDKDNKRVILGNFDNTKDATKKQKQLLAVGIKAKIVSK